MDQQTRHTYRQIAAVFAEANRDRSVLLDDMAAFAGGLPAGALVVDVGCGPGFDAALLRREHGLNAIGLDYSHTMINTGRDEFEVNVPFVQASMGQMPFAPGSLDGIWACASLLHLPRADLPAVLAHFARLLRPTAVSISPSNKAKAAVTPNAPMARKRPATSPTGSLKRSIRS
jgi:ubiquinone/menaquinone biosynthesis C-methylase UbiE